MRSPSVIVIGGGIAGVAAARALHDASFQVCTIKNKRKTIVSQDMVKFRQPNVAFPNYIFCFYCMLFREIHLRHHVGTQRN